MGGQLEPDGTKPVSGVLVGALILGGAVAVFAFLLVTSGFLGG